MGPYLAWKAGSILTYGELLELKSKKAPYRLVIAANLGPGKAARG